MTDSPIGRELAGYRIEALLGEGGMGVVYRATNPVLGRTAAIKLLGPRHAQDPAIRERFMREPRSAAAINHPNIIAVYHAGTDGGQPFLIMQYVVGGDLRMLIGENVALPFARAIALVEQVAGALDAAHARDLVHRDVKPENVLVEAATDRAYLTDFGLARDLLAGGQTEAGQFLGTPHYAAPEQIVGGAPCPEVDQYALGCVLYECLSREPPFAGRTREQIMHRHLQDPPPSLSERRPDLPRELDDVIARALSKEPAERFSSCTAMIDAARAAVSEQRAAGPLPPLAVSQPGRAATPPLAVSRAGRAARPPLAVSRAGPAARPPLAVSRAGPAARPPRSVPWRSRAAATVPSPAAAEADAGSSAAGADGLRVSRGRAAALRASRGRAAALRAAALALVAAACAGGFTVGRHGGHVLPAAITPLPGTAGNAELAVRVPAGWQRLTAPAIPGIAIADAIAATPDYGASVTVVAGLAKTEGPRLLPAAGLKLAEPLPRPDAVALGLLQARRYRGMRLRGATGPMTLFAVQTDRGTAMIACLAATPAVASAFAADCDRIAASMRLLTAEPYPLGPSTTFAHQVDRVLNRLGADRLSAGAQLRDATTAHGQARSARRVSDAYSDAARALESIGVAPSDATARRELVVALRRAATAFRRLARAAQQQLSATFRRARVVTMAAVRRLEGAIAGLSSAGYRVS